MDGQVCCAKLVSCPIAPGQMRTPLRSLLQFHDACMATDVSLRSHWFHTPIAVICRCMPVATKSGLSSTGDKTRRYLDALCSCLNPLP